MAEDWQTLTATDLDHRHLKWTKVDRFVLLPLLLISFVANIQVAGVLLLIGWLSGRFLWPWAARQTPRLLGIVERILKRGDRSLWVIGIDTVAHDGQAQTRSQAALIALRRAIVPALFVFFVMVSVAQTQVQGSGQTNLQNVFGDDPGHTPWTEACAAGSFWNGTDVGQARAQVYRDELATAQSNDSIRSDLGITPPDADCDGLLDTGEILAGTNATRWDTDRDGRSDGGEVADRTDPADAYDVVLRDTDGDGLSDDTEDWLHGTLIDEEDTDGDSTNDLAEVRAGTPPRTNEALGLIIIAVMGAPLLSFFLTPLFVTEDAGVVLVVPNRRRMMPLGDRLAGMVNAFAGAGVFIALAGLAWDALTSAEKGGEAVIEGVIGPFVLAFTIMLAPVWVAALTYGKRHHEHVAALEAAAEARIGLTPHLISTVDGLRVRISPMPTRPPSAAPSAGLSDPTSPPPEAPSPLTAQPSIGAGPGPVAAPAVAMEGPASTPPSVPPSSAAPPSLPPSAPPPAPPPQTPPPGTAPPASPGAPPDPVMPPAGAPMQPLPPASAPAVALPSSTPAAPTSAPPNWQP